MMAIRSSGSNREPGECAPTYVFEEYEIDTGRRELRRSGVVVPCEPKVFSVLAYLAENADRTVPRRELMDELWPGETVAEDSLNRSISRARQILGDTKSPRRVIRTVSGQGYVFQAPLVRMAPDVEASEPESAGDASNPGWVGRQPELAKLDALLQEAISSTTRIAWVSGDAGVGKTRLIEEFTRLAHRRDVEVLRGAVPQERGSPPLWLWHDLLLRVFSDLPRLELERLLGDSARLLAQVFPALRRRFPDLPAPDEPGTAEAQFRLFSAVQRFVARLAELRPLVLVLEDAHWADHTSLSLLQFLARHRVAARVLILVAFRTNDLPSGDARIALASATRAEPIVEPIPLAGLGEQETARLSWLVAGRRVGERWEGILAEKTEGNPLAILEIVRWLDDQGAFQRSPVPTKTLPSGARATMSRSLDRLSSSCTWVLERAAVFGRSFPVDLLLQIARDPGVGLPPGAGDPEDRVLRALDEGVSRHLIARDDATAGAYGFRHALFREVLYGRLLESERIQLHRRVADLIEQRHRLSRQLPVDLLVYHLSQSPFDAERTFRYAEEAAERAVRVRAYAEGVELYHQVLRSLESIAPEDDPRVAKALHSLALAQNGAGRHADAVATFQRLILLRRASDDSKGLAEAAVGLEEARYTARTTSRAPATDSIPLLEEALRVIPRTPSRLRFQVIERLAAAMNVANDPRRAEHSAEALEIARKLGDPLALIRALMTRHVAIWGPDSLTERLEIGNEIIRVSQEVDRSADSFGVGTTVWGHTVRISDLLEIGDPSALEGAIDGATIQLGTPGSNDPPEIAQRITADTHLTIHVEWMRLVRSSLLILRGALAEADSVLVDVARRAQQLEAGNVLEGAQIQFFGLRYLQGRVAEVLPLAQAMLDQNPGFSASIRTSIALALASFGDKKEEALEQIAAVVADDLAPLPRDGFWIFALCNLAEALFLLQTSGPAARIYEHLLPHADRNAVSTVAYCSGSVARYLGMLGTLLGDYDRAEEHFATAISNNRTMGAHAFEALAQYEYAVLLELRRGVGDRAAARELLASAARSGHELPRLIERIRALSSTFDA